MAAAQDWNGTDIGPATHAEAVTPSDSADLVRVTRAVYVGGLGDINVVMADGSTATFKAVPAGSVLPIRVSRVKATSTTATLIIGLA